MPISAWLLLALTLLRLAAAAVMPLSPDEAYYWVWSHALAAGYPDHPPMVALFIRVGTALAGDSALGVRLLAPLAAALATLAVVRAADTLFPARRPGVRAGWMFNATLLVSGAAVTMTPDTPLLLFAALTLWAASGGRWVRAGLAAGLALASKYTALLLAPALLLWAWRGGQLRRWGPWLGAVLAGAVFAPVLAWNAAHGWASFVRQGGRLADWQPARAAQFLGELLGGQLGLLTPGVAILATIGAVRMARQWRDPAQGFVLALIAVPGLVFLQHALGDRVQANWPLILYPAAAIAAALAWARWAVGLGLGIGALAMVQATLAPLPLPARFDPALHQLGGWRAFGVAVAQAERQHGAGWVVADNYGIGSALAFQRIGAVYGADPRWALFALPARRPPGAGLLVRSAHRTDPPDPALWAQVVPAGTLARGRDGLVADEYRLFLVQPRVPLTLLSTEP